MDGEQQPNGLSHCYRDEKYQNQKILGLFIGPGTVKKGYLTAGQLWSRWYLMQDKH